MHRRRSCHAALVAAALLAFTLSTGFVAAQPTPPEPVSAQPTLPQPLPPATTKPGSPIVEQIVGEDRPPLVVRKQVVRTVTVRRRHVVRHFRVPRDLERPALARVELLAPLPPPEEPPHITVPLPAYPLDSIATAFLTPPPPIVCHRTRRDPDVPDPHLHREVPVECVPDNP